MKQKLFMILGIILLMCCSGCDSNAIDENQMPDIVFVYMRDNSTMKKRYDTWIIDKEGKIYNNIDDEFKGMHSIMEEYQTIQSNGKWTFMKQIGTEEVKSQYEILKDISVSDNNIVNRGETVVDVYQGTKEWMGLCFDKKGNLIYVELHKEGDSYYTNEDTRAKELADWMSEVIDLEKIDKKDKQESCGYIIEE